MDFECHYEIKITIKELQIKNTIRIPLNNAIFYMRVNAKPF